MNNFCFILAGLSLGFLFQNKNIFPLNASLTLNRFIIFLSLPALTLKELHNQSLSFSQAPIIAMAWILFILGTIFFFFLARWQKIPREILGSLLLTGSLGNTSFVGFPLLEALFGSSALATGILVDQPGTFLVAGTLGIAMAGFLSSQKTGPRVILKKIISFPPFQATLLALLLKPWQFPDGLNLLLDRLAATLMPLALIAVGLQLKIDRKHLRKHWRNLALGLGFKLILAPLAMTLIYLCVFSLQGETLRIVLVESAMAPMITAGIIANEFKFDEELTSLMIGLGIPLSLVSVPLFNFFLLRVL